MYFSLSMFMCLYRLPTVCLIRNILFEGPCSHLNSITGMFDYDARTQITPPNPMNPHFFQTSRYLIYHYEGFTVHKRWILVCGVVKMFCLMSPFWIAVSILAILLDYITSRKSCFHYSHMHICSFTIQLNKHQLADPSWPKLHVRDHNWWRKTQPKGTTRQCTLSSGPKPGQMGRLASGRVFGIKSLADEICRSSRMTFSGLRTAIGAVD